MSNCCRGPATASRCELWNDRLSRLLGLAFLPDSSSSRMGLHSHHGSAPSTDGRGETRARTALRGMADTPSRHGRGLGSQHQQRVPQST